MCSRLKKIIEVKEEIQYIIELEIAGLEDNPRCNWSYAKRLQCLTRYQSAWDQFKWSKQSVVPNLKRLWELNGGVLGQGDTNDVFHFSRLPSEVRQIQEESWTIRPEIRDIQDFGMDPSQDLLIWILRPSTTPRLELHFRTLATGEEHPLARQPVVSYDQPPTLDVGHWREFFIRVSQDYVGLQREQAHVERGDDESLKTVEIFIWNWKEGKLELVCSVNSICISQNSQQRHS